MRNRRERTLRELCDVTPTLSLPQITPVLRGNFRMQGPNDEANCDSLTNMVTSENSSRCSGKSQKVDCRGKSGTCNVCSAPCSSCFHVKKALLKSNNESAGETCAGNTETGQLSILSAVGGMDSTADSFSENAAGKASSRTSNASASDDSVVHSKCEGRRSPEGHDDCLSCVSGTDEQGNRKSDSEDTGNKNNKQGKYSGEVSGKMSPSSSQTGTYSHYSGTMGTSCTKSTDDVTDIQKVQTTTQASNGKNLPHEESAMDVNDDKPSDTQAELLKCSTEHLNTSSPNCVASDDVCGDPPKVDHNSIEKNDDMEVELDPTNESDDSDMVEQDVKVCDICGDAGREELLAICSRCSDGAEHTYCMRVRLDKVPEGEWLCEECKTLELVGNKKQEKIGSMDENEKNNSSGRVSENLNNSDVEGHRTKGSTKTLKRIRDDEDVEVSSIAKKPAFESTTVGSQKMSNSKIALLSRENSLKNLDKGRLQSPNCSTSDTIPVNDATELAKPASDARGLNLRGTFSKSNSFSSLNSKPKVKLVDQVIQRQKSAKEHGSFRLKEGAVRSIGKSMSFRSTNSNRSESKTKMLSPRPSHIQDVKNIKDRSAFERQRSFKTEHPSNNSMMGTSMSSSSRIDKRPSFRVESSSLTTPTNHHEVKPVQTDGKSAALSRSSSLAVRRNADLSGSTGEFKRPSKHGHTTAVLSSSNGVNNTEHKNNQTNLKLDPVSSPSPGVSEKSPVNGSEALSDRLVQSKDLTDSADRQREYTGSRFGPPSVRSSRDETDSLKAAIEAAVLRKPGVYRKHRALGQSDESSVPTVASVASSTDHMSSARHKKLSSDAELAESPPVSRNWTAGSLQEETTNSVKQSLLVPAEGLSSGGRDGVHAGLSSRDTFINIPAIIPLSLKSTAIPEHEFIWQGSFEICRSNQTFELCDGIQAHLSTCASPRVVESVNKFKNRIVLYEVPRVSTWPVQFQENGVREDNIALFFFAKDLQSHGKIYKVLMDNMMKNDLALKGNINGAELLIFPSNKLPVNLQRWNMLFFLWGVFRGKKESSLRQLPGSITAPRDIPPPIMSLPENRCSLTPIITVNASQDVHQGIEVPPSEGLQGLARVVKRDFVVDIPPLDQLSHGLNSSLPSALQSEGAEQCGEVRAANMEGGISSSCSPPVVTTSSGSEREEMLLQPDTPLGNQHLPHDSGKLEAGMSKEGTGEGAILQKTCHQNQLKLRTDAIDLSTVTEIPLEGRDLNLEPEAIPEKMCHQNQLKMRTDTIDLSTDTKIPLEGRDLNLEPEAIPEKMCHQNQLKMRTDAIDLSTATEIPLEGRDLNLEPEAILEKMCHQNQLKMRTDAIDLSTDTEIPLEGRDLNLEPDKWLFSQKEPILPVPSPLGNHTLCAGTSQVSHRNDDVYNKTCRIFESVNHLPMVTYPVQNQHDEADVGSSTIPKYYDHAERFFFPVQTQPVAGLPLPDESMLWKTHLLDKDRVNDKAPNLELALGAEIKPLSLGIEPLFVSKVEHKVHEEHILEEARKKAEDDVSASLSLSLSFPFPEKEVDAKPSPKTEQLLSQMNHVNTSSRLLFGNLRDN